MCCPDRLEESATPNDCTLRSERDSARGAHGLQDRQLVPAAVVLYKPDCGVLGRLLRALEHANRRIFLFANGPLDSSIEALISSVPNVWLSRGVANIGLGAALNVLLEAAEAEGFKRVLIFDQDSEPSGTCPEELSSHFDEAERLGACVAVMGPLLYPPQEGNYRPLRYFWRDQRAGTVDFVPTWGSLISIEAWRQIGPFRADFFIDGIDVEWGFRAWSVGYASLIAKDIRVLHRWGTEAESRNMPQVLRQSDRRRYYYFRNAIHCIRLPHIPLRWKVAYSAPVMVIQPMLLLIQRRAATPVRQLLARAVADGWNGRLGPFPANLLEDLT